MNKYKKEILSQYGLSEYDLNCPECGSKLELDDHTCICHNCWYQEDISEFIHTTSGLLLSKDQRE